MADIQNPEIGITHALPDKVGVLHTCHLTGSHGSNNGSQFWSSLQSWGDGPRSCTSVHGYARLQHVQHAQECKDESRIQCSSGLSQTNNECMVETVDDNSNTVNKSISSTQDDTGDSVGMKPFEKQSLETDPEENFSFDMESWSLAASPKKDFCLSGCMFCRGCQRERSRNTQDSNSCRSVFHRLQSSHKTPISRVHGQSSPNCVGDKSICFRTSHCSKKFTDIDQNGNSEYIFTVLVFPFPQQYLSFREELHLRCEVYERFKVKAEARAFLVITEEKWTYLTQRWRYMSAQTRVWQWKLDSNLPGRVGQIGDWLYRAEELVDGAMVEHHTSHRDTANSVQEKITEIKVRER